MMRFSSDLKPFGMVPREKRRTGAPWAFDNVEIVGSPPRVFQQGALLIADGVAIVCVLLIIFTKQPRSAVSIISTEALFLLSTLLLVHARRVNRFSQALLEYGMVSILSLLLNLFFPGNWGNIWLIGACAFVIYRFPFRWVWPFLVVNSVLLAATNDMFLLFRQGGGLGLLTMFLALAAVCWTGYSRRVRDLLVIELQKVQEQLRAEMARTEKLATTRERTRIARDIHDVLAHTLTILSVQVQAARQLVRQDPERLSAKLDDIAALLKESLAESRRVVGLLREPAPTVSEPDDAATKLRVLMERFGERTGIRCVFEESGKAAPLSEKQLETLQYALQEALTNAHRHGSARHVEVVLRWQEAAVRLSVQDDGLGEAASPTSKGSGYGLQGIRERAAAVDGTVEAAAQAQGGFVVTVQLPLSAQLLAQLQGEKR
ncbi:MAG TPA: sensor histidine kinase [Ktedonobacteraceae bacterium]|nr:sensor histidine kinase [Ktedonobacteraceae bacterium]